MSLDAPATLTLDDLAAEVSRLLAERGILGAPDGRVSAVPDARTIRYYATLGLLDRPLAMGRQARYGRRHVLQLLAIKVLQGETLPLAEIQARLYGRSDGELEAIVAAASGRPAPAPESPRPILWREVAIEPGLKLMAEATWAPGRGPEALLEKIRAALAALGVGGKDQ